MGVQTEITLKEWRYGQTQAELLCSGILVTEGYQSVDPQCPLGGPDGIKDITCLKDGFRFIAGAYFPTTGSSFREIKNKFSHDLKGVEKNSSQGFVFLTNQKLTPTEREELSELASDKGYLCEIYHLHRMQAILDSPKGYGLRIEYLRIPMSQEEQYGFWAVWSSDFRNFFIRQQDCIDTLSLKIDNMMQTQSFMLRAISHKMNTIEVPDEEYREKLASINLGPQISSFLSVNIIFLIHRALCFHNEPVYRFSGRFREVNVWIGKQGSTAETASYVPPVAQEVPALIDNLFKSWNENYKDLAQKDQNEKLFNIIKFYHGFLLIHPFLDANGRVAIFLLNQVVKDLLGIDRFIILDKDARYYSALQQADRGNLDYLKRILEDIISRNP